MYQNSKVFFTNQISITVKFIKFGIFGISMENNVKNHQILTNFVLKNIFFLY